MSKRIAQNTFDDVVQENIDEFEMEPSAALGDAIEQFTKQGIDLMNIDATGDITGRNKMNQHIKDAIHIFQSVSSTIGNDMSTEASLNSVNEIVAIIKNMIDKSYSNSSRNLILLKESELANNIHLMLVPTQNKDLLIKIMDFYKELCQTNIDIRDAFEPGGSKRIVNILKSASAEVNKPLIICGFQLARVVAKTEYNKAILMREGLGEVICDLLSQLTENDLSEALGNHQRMIFQESCKLIRGLCIHDDLRKDMSCAYDNGKFFIKKNGIVQALMKLSAAFREEPVIASAALYAARNLITTEEAVQIMSQHGAMELPRAILSYQSADINLVKSVIGLMRNLCADDVRKDKLVMDGTLQLLAFALSNPLVQNDVILVEHGLACLAAMSLRSPNNSEKIVSYGAIEIIVNLMHKHKDAQALLRQGCLLIRNIAGRCPEFRSLLLDNGAESILRSAGLFPAVTDEAYAALRDLECEVQYVRVTEDGKIEPAFEQFGAKTKLNFNPIYDEDNDISQRIQEEAKPPFQAANIDYDSSDEFEMDHSHSHTHNNNFNNKCCDHSGGEIDNNDHNHQHEHEHDQTSHTPFTNIG
eukprot:gene5435-7528_t